jgi:signal transduction histidine kinase
MPFFPCHRAQSMAMPGSTSSKAPPERPLSSFLRENAAAIANRWVDRLRDQSASSALPTSELKNSMREFVEEVAGALEQDESSEVLLPAARARQHGEQRFRLGYNIDGLIREYGTLREVLFEFMEANGIPVSPQDALDLSGILIEGIASAAAQYSLERDAQTRTQAAEHVGFLAHELRNPLQTAQLRVEMMKRRGAGPTPGDVQALERALRLLRERIDNELFDVQLHAFPEPIFKKLLLRHVLDAVAEDVAPQGEGKDVEILVDADPTLEISADERLLDSALSNLVRNAVKFSAPGATVRLHAKQSEDRVVIEVEDQCGGLPEGAVEKMFSPFVQLGQDRSGFGLGLAISKRAAEVHGGGLRVHDLPGRGCVFVLDLPLDPSVHLQELEKQPSE